MFPLGIFLLILGYAGAYTGAANLRNGGQGPTFAQSLGFTRVLAPPGADTPNLTGQPPAVSGQAGQSNGSGGGGGGTSF